VYGDVFVQYHNSVQVKNIYASNGATVTVTLQINVQNTALTLEISDDKHYVLIKLLLPVQGADENIMVKD
jgi:hypothetical protein